MAKPRAHSPRRSKGKNERYHAKQRAFERFGLDLTNQDLNRIVQQIRGRRFQAHQEDVIE